MPTETNKTAATQRYLKRILGLWQEYAPVSALAEKIENNDTGAATAVTGLPGSAPAFLLNALHGRLLRPIVAVTETSDDAVHLFDDLVTVLGPDRVAHYPTRQILPYDFKAPQGEIMGRRISALSHLLDNRAAVVVAPIRALLEPTIARDLLADSRIRLEVGGEADLDEVVDRLVALGFRRVPVVEEVGDFALRGGLIDFFSPGAEAPSRVEFFGDEVDTIRLFDVATQRTIERVDRVELLPRREVPITMETIEKYLESIPDHDADYIRDRYLNDPELPGLEWLSILFGVKQGRFFDYLPDNAVIWLSGEEQLREEAEDIFEEGTQLYHRLKGRLENLPTPDQYYSSIEETFGRTERYHRIDAVPFRGGRREIIDFGCKPHPALASRLDLLVETTREFDALGLTYFVATDTETQAKRLDELIGERVGPASRPVLQPADLRGGFVCQKGRFAILTDHEIFGRHHRRVRRKKFKEGVAISDYSSLNKGDFVVHTDHGIARYLGLETLTIDQRNRDCLALLYAENDKLYVPIEEFNRVSKYSGKDTAPQLTRLGGPAWDKLKTKTKKAITDMAEDLLKLYARRKSADGYSFGEDTVWLRQLEAAFQYEETPDQLKAINDVKSDMTKQEPMDRLIVGDVGYGKTEVAVRAAFKAIEKGKQVAVLVPTTILAQQHFQTFTERLGEFPVRIEILSRFRTRKQQLAVIEDLAAGKVDLVIGTHRLLSKDVVIPNLGLLVVDEEHRFGVRHKEKLRQLRATVDTIAMSATPIPRTLHMSLMSVRDMSLITTSPKDRLPIITEIVEFDPAIIATAILREMERGGQVFFVHNRVQTIEAMHEYLRKVVPQAEIAVAHGQMHERSLEGIMLAFLARRFDVLLCTSIIESGLDIPNANTIIINRADRFGLAQLYQMRGRVGRSATRAYAYLMTPPVKQLQPDSIKRLRALEAHSDLGSGFALAMRDLEIRGAGTVLGAKQSGYIEEIGFDMYNKLLEEAVAELKGEELLRPPDTKLELDLELYLPDDYINERQQKVDIYRRLADSTRLEDIERIRDEVTDRFGKLPESSVNLFDATAVKIAAAAIHIEKVKMSGGRVNLFFEEGRQLTRATVEQLRGATDCPMEFSLIGRVQIMLDLGTIAQKDRLPYLRKLLGSAEPT